MYGPFLVLGFHFWCPLTKRLSKTHSPLNHVLFRLILTHQQQTALESIVEKGEIARNEQFLLFPQCFLLNKIIVSPSVHTFHIIPSFAAEFEEPKIGISGLTIHSTFNILYKSIYHYLQFII